LLVSEAGAKCFRDLTEAAASAWTYRRDITVISKGG
jgi:hypothetical protein